MKVVIAGGGLAGLACAKRLVEAGHQVTVVLFLGACSEFRALLRDIGRPPDEVLAWTTRIRAAGSGRSGRGDLRDRSAAFARRDAASVLGNNDYLGPLDKLSLLPIVAPGLRSYEALDKDWDGRTVTDLWRRSGDDTVMRRYLRPFCRAIQFTEPEQFSAFDFLIRPLGGRPRALTLAWCHRDLFARSRRSRRSPRPRAARAARGRSPPTSARTGRVGPSTTRRG